ncbi:MAG: ribosome maturation factor RimP [Clostridia bacterium]|nr:ribosome maturation factor RimP [Clostridia bacterium]
MAKNIAGTVKTLVEPIVKDFGLELWDVEFVREGADNILRITIDKPTGVFIEDCEKVHRAIDPLLDENDPIEQSYRLEVSSPGLCRQIKNEEQAEKCMGLDVNAKFYAPDEKGRRVVKGKLEKYENDKIEIKIGDEVLTTEIKNIAKLSLADDDE